MVKCGNPFSQYPGLDTTKALKQLGDNHVLYHRLLKKFQANHGHSIHEIHHAIEQGKSEEAYRLAHSLKGVAATIGAWKLQETAGHIVQGLKKKQDVVCYFDSGKQQIAEIIEAIMQIAPPEESS